MITWLIHACLLMGTAFLLLAAIGLARLPDVYMRLQATSKAVTMGVGWMMLAVALHFEAPGGILRAIAVFNFVYFSAPVAAHLIGRAAYRMKAPLWHGTIFDELSEHVESSKQNQKAREGSSVHS
jgi:multicomponent Na+:H+ antiporter subunit G